MVICTLKGHLQFQACSFVVVWSCNLVPSMMSHRSCQLASPLSGRPASVWNWKTPSQWLYMEQTERGAAAWIFELRTLTRNGLNLDRQCATMYGHDMTTHNGQDTTFLSTIMVFYEVQREYVASCREFVASFSTGLRVKRHNQIMCLVLQLSVQICTKEGLQTLVE